jgi:mono/diheme cytochrome c family protein
VLHWRTLWTWFEGGRRAAKGRLHPYEAPAQPIGAHMPLPKMVRVRSTMRAAALAVPFIFTSHLSPGQQSPAAGDAAEGRRLAESLCGPCHVVASDQAAAPILKGPLRPPSFVAILQKREVDGTYLRAFITVEHVNAKPPVVMPNLQLTDNEREAIVDYMLSLRQH